MPRQDKTGPEGKGPMTGRGLGICGSGDDSSAPAPRRGMGLGRGVGRGIPRGRGRGMGRGLGRRGVN